MGLLEYFKEKAQEEVTFMLQDDGSFKINTTDIQAMDTEEMPSKLCQVIPVVGSSQNHTPENDELHAIVTNNMGAESVLDSPEKLNLTILLIYQVQ